MLTSEHCISPAAQQKLWNATLSVSVQALVDGFSRIKRVCILPGFSIQLLISAFFPTVLYRRSGSDVS
jgi:hypothetical protein